MERSDIPRLARTHAKAKYKGFIYTMSGYKVEYRKGGEIDSVLLLDDRENMIWARYTDVEVV